MAILNPEKINARVTVFVSIRTNSHSHEWLRRFSEVIQDFPEVSRVLAAFEARPAVQRAVNIPKRPE